ncbi:hypothetical protein [Pseudoduganella armeniaca]|nr:hypothetical protein [Pseudoduganella armeniaca]
MSKSNSRKALRNKNKLGQPTDDTPLAAPDEDMRMAIWFAVLGVGAVGLFSYFFHIEYFPIFDLAAATSLFLSFAYVCLIVLPLLSGLFLFPYLIHTVSLRQASQKQGTEQSLAQIATRAGICSLQLLLLGFTLGFFAMQDWSPAAGLLAYLCLSAAIAGWFFVASNRALRKDPNSPLARARPHLPALLPDICMTGVLQLFCLVLLWLFLAQGSPAQQDDWMAYYTNVAAVAFFLGLAGAALMYCLAQPWGRRTAYLLIPLFLVVPYIFTALIQGTGAIPMTVARLTKIGNFRAERLVVKGSSCAKLPPELGLACDNDDDAPPIHLCNVHVMSRPGSELYVRLALPKTDSKGEHPVIALFLPSDEAQPVQINTKKKFMHLDNIERTLRTEGPACPVPPSDSAVWLPFQKQQAILSVAANARLQPIIARLASDPESISEVSIIGHAADDEQEASALVRQRTLETRRTLARELRTLDGRNLPALVVRTTGPEERQACDSTYTAAECADAQRRVEVRLVPRPRPRSANDSASGPK